MFLGAIGGTIVALLFCLVEYRAIRRLQGHTFDWGPTVWRSTELLGRPCCPSDRTVVVRHTRFLCPSDSLCRFTRVSPSLWDWFAFSSRELFGRLPIKGQAQWQNDKAEFIVRFPVWPFIFSAFWSVGWLSFDLASWELTGSTFLALSPFPLCGLFLWGARHAARLAVYDVKLFLSGELDETAT